MPPCDPIVVFYIIGIAHFEILLTRDRGVYSSPNVVFEGEHIMEQKEVLLDFGDVYC